MKRLLFMLLASFHCLAQEPQAALESPEFNVLYRGYPNVLVPAVTNNDNREVVLVGSPNVVITRQADSISYTVKPTGKEKMVNLTVGLMERGSIIHVRTIPYRSINLPDPTLYWGGARDGGLANIKLLKLFAKYPPEIPLNATFRVLNWKIEWNGEYIKGQGANLKSAEDFLKKIDEETEVSITTTVVGPDRVEREISAKWKVKPWSETEDSEIYIFRCD